MTPRILQTLLVIAILSNANFILAADECTATAEYTYQTANHTVFFHNQSTSTGETSTWHWDFGDGVTSENSGPIYAYADYGTFHCCLTISSNSTDGTCQDTYCLDVVVEPGGQCVVETDFEIESLVNGQAMFIPDCQTNGGTQVDSWEWDFEGASNSEDTPVWEFEDAENHSVCLTAFASNDDNVCSSVKCQDIAVDNFICELGTEFKITNKECGVDLDYQFDQLGQFTEATDFIWTFSDGTEESGASVSHSFDESGTYEVCLLVVGNCPSSACLETMCTTIDVVCPEPVDWNLPDADDSDEIKHETEVALNIMDTEAMRIRVYPNPTTDILRFETNVGIDQVSLWSLTGQQVKLESASSMKQLIVDVSSLNYGMYVYNVLLTDGQIITGQVTKL
jgi:PKD repeat protein